MYVPGITGLPDETREPLGEGFETIHHTLAWVIVVLLGLHVAGAVKHQFVDRDGLLARMAPGLFGRTAGPPDNGHGALWAFGAAALLFAVAAASSMIAAAPPASSPAVADLGAPPASAPATPAVTAPIPATPAATAPTTPTAVAAPA